MKRITSKCRLHLKAILPLLVAACLLTPASIQALTVGDPTDIPSMNRLSTGVEFEYDRREMDYGDTSLSSRVLGKVGYTIYHDFGIYMKAGLFRTETFYGTNSDWGLGIGFGLNGKVLDFMDGKIQLGLDGHIFRAQTDHSTQNRLESESIDEEITWTEYEFSAVLSWRAYTPLYLYTGIQFSKINADYDLAYYNWDTEEELSESFKKEEDMPVALLWGVTYHIMDQVGLFAELKALSDISATIGLNLNF